MVVLRYRVKVWMPYPIEDYKWEEETEQFSTFAQAKEWFERLDTWMDERGKSIITLEAVSGKGESQNGTVKTKKKKKSSSKESAKEAKVDKDKKDKIQKLKEAHKKIIEGILDSHTKEDKIND